MNQIEIKSKQVRFPVSKDLYGLFYEDINRSGDSGIYPEMLRNRSFEDSLPPTGCQLDEHGAQFVTPTGWVGEFHGGEGLKRWAAQWDKTPIPAWYTRGEARLNLELEDTLNKQRLSSLDVSFLEDGASLYNIGYGGICAQQGKALLFYMFAKSLGGPETVALSLQDPEGKELAKASVVVEPGDFKHYDCRLVPQECCGQAQFHLSAAAGTRLRLGFVSLMPEETWMGHGLRKDILEKLAGLSPQFMRFPGGCIVEGVTKENALRFSQMMGPVWERPSNFLLWFYRTTNGFGYHEFLQMCEDMGMSAMYVVNCGMTCQARKPDFFYGEELEELYQECVNAIDYALAPTGTEMGDRRAAAGHPEPFPLKYLEIGNENRDEPYFHYYKWFYDRLKKAYPQLIYISNCHTEEQGLPTEVVDEHFYSDLDFFVCHHDMYDSYDRKGPKVFVGEYAVTAGEHQSAMAAALGEGAFLTGIERNQDIVALTSYAPLLLNEKFMCWTPDLIVFNGAESYGIPSYYLQQMFARNRGTHVIDIKTSSSRTYLDQPGWAGLWAEGVGTRIRDILIDGRPQTELSEVPAMFQPVFPFLKGENGWISRDEAAYGLFLGEKWAETHYQAAVTLDSTGGAALTLGNRLIARGLAAADSLLLNYEGLVYYAWKIQHGQSALYVVRREKVDRISPLVEVDLDESEHIWSMEWNRHRFTCRIDGKVIHSEIEAASMPYFTASAVIDQEQGDIILKLVNVMDEPLDIPICFDCPVEQEAQGELLAAASKTDRNSMAEPEKVSPKRFTLKDAGKECIYHAPGNSVNIIRYHKKESV